MEPKNYYLHPVCWVKIVLKKRFCRYQGDKVLIWRKKNPKILLSFLKNWCSLGINTPSHVWYIWHGLNEGITGPLLFHKLSFLSIVKIIYYYSCNMCYKYANMTIMIIMIIDNPSTITQLLLASFSCRFYPTTQFTYSTNWYIGHPIIVLKQCSPVFDN